MAGRRAPSRKARLIALAMSGVGAAAIAIWQGVGTGLVDRLFGTVDAQASLSAQRADRSGGAQPNSAGAGVAPVPASVPPQLPDREIVRARIPISVSAVGVASTEARACAGAVQNLTRQVERQCDLMVIEQRGTSRRLDTGGIECGTCGVTGGAWRCVAQAAPECTIIGGGGNEIEE